MTSDCDCILLDSSVLPLLLQHETFLADPSVLLLMSTASKVMREAVLHQCSGRVEISFKPSSDQQVELFAQWLVKNGQLLAALTVDGAALRWVEGEAYAISAVLVRRTIQLLAESLQQHTQQYGRIPLRQLRLHHHFGGGFTTAVLQTLSPSTLTSLVVEPRHYEHEVSLHSCPMSAFTKLQSLKLYWLTTEAAKSLITTLPALIDLKALELTGRVTDFSTELLPQLPSSLRTLVFKEHPDKRIVVDDDIINIEPALLHLQQMTALRSLCVDNISDDSQLPQRLNDLSCCGCSSLQPLLPCMQLKNLEIRHCCIPAADVHRLSCFASLSCISLWVEQPVDSMATAFEHTPMNTGLRELELCVCRDGALQAYTIQQLQWLAGLTRLNLSFWVGPPPGTPMQLAASVKCLTALSKLQLNLCDPRSPWKDDLENEQLSRLLETAGWSSSNIRTLTETIAGLSRLTDLTLYSVGLAEEAIEPLARPDKKQSRLRHLSIIHIMCTVHACMLRVLSTNPLISDALLPRLIRALMLRKTW